MAAWQRIRAWLGFDAIEQIATGPKFAVDSSAIPAEIFGLTSYTDPISPVARVTRNEAIQVPAVKRGRDLIAGTIGQLPFVVLDTENVQAVSNLLTQPERSCARSITMSRTVEDLLFEGVSWWKTTERDFRNYPVKIERLPVRSVFFDADRKQWYVDRNSASWTLPNGNVESGNSSRREYLNDRDLIRFDSPTDPVLVAGARAIRTYLKLATAADRYADEPMPSGYFTPRAEADPDDADVTVFLDDWAAARRTRATAYVPGLVDYHTVQWTPEQLQMDQARTGAVTELARLLGVDPEDLGVSTTSRTYQNSQDRRISLINDTLGMYISALTERLSMGDVTPRGYRVAADFNGFLKADDKTRLESYVLGKALGIYDRKAIAEREGLPEPMFPEPQAAPAGANVSRETVGAHEADVSRETFDADETQFGFDTPATRETFSVDTERRTISGLAVPYGVAAKKNGQTWQFSKGSLSWAHPSRVKLLIQHDRSQAVGRALELTDTDRGLFAKFKVARTPEGDRALALAEDLVYDGLSVGLDGSATFDRREGINHSRAGNLLAEISLTPTPAYDDARVSAVVAEADDPKGKTMAHEPTETVAPVAPVAPTFDMDALNGLILEAVRKHGTVTEVAGGPEVIAPTGGAATFEVNEPAPYVFDRSGNLHKGSHDFSTDLFAGLRDRDTEAMGRVLKFMQVQFDVDLADTASVNPSGQRPDLYVNQKAYHFPLWEAVSKGSLTDVTPFIIPKWSSDTTLVAAHVEGVAPTAGTFVATSQTVTPTALSGKVEITREVWDQGGNPNVSNLIWQKMVRAYYEALEAKVVTVLDAASPTGITLTAGGGTTGQTASAELAAAFAALQYIRGGFSFDTFAAQIDLYKLLSGALDGNKRPLFPILGPSNANGTSAARFASMDVHGVPVFPAWALAATGSAAASSYLFDRADVFAAASAPQRLEFQYRVEYVDLAVWGYLACAITDLTGVREVIYDPVP